MCILGRNAGPVLNRQNVPCIGVPIKQSVGDPTQAFYYMS
jgi:hypothetical protein